MVSGSPDNLLDSYGTVGPLLPTLFASPVVGVAILDSRLRFRSINAALASMNGLPVVQHVGKKVRAVLGRAARHVEAPIDQVLQTGKPLSIELRAQLPLRSAPGHWFESYFPIRDTKSRVMQVAVVVVEVLDRENLDTRRIQLVERLSAVQLRLTSESKIGIRRSKSSENQALLVRETMALAAECIAMAQSVCAVRSTPSSELIPARSVFKHPMNGPDTVPTLSPRERHVLQLLVTGSSNKEVAAVLTLSVRTVEVYRARLMKKTGLHSMAELVRFAVRNKFIEP